MTDKIKTNVIARYDYFFSINVHGLPKGSLLRFPRLPEAAMLCLLRNRLKLI